MITQGNSQYNRIITIFPQIVTMQDIGTYTHKERAIIENAQTSQCTVHIYIMRGTRKHKTSFKIKWFNALGYIKETSEVVNFWIHIKCFLMLAYVLFIFQSSIITVFITFLFMKYMWKCLYYMAFQQFNNTALWLTVRLFCEIHYGNDTTYYFGFYCLRNNNIS